MSKIRIVIVDDSLFFRTFVKNRLQMESSFEIAGSFGDPLEASARIGELRPDVIAVDMEMPKMRGSEFLRTVLPKNPTVKAIVISAISHNVFDAMQAGAIDFVEKPGSRQGFDQEQFIQEIIQKIKVAATARAVSPAKVSARSPAPVSASVKMHNFSKATGKSVIAIGASTGGTEAILAVVKKFPANTPGVVIVQHMPPVFTGMYAERVNKLCAMDVREAQNGDRVKQGTMLIAPGGDQQMYLRSDAGGYYVHLAPGAKVSGHCPSVDVLFESVAAAAGASAVGVLLTGMGADGAKGLTSMRHAGAHTIGQDKESCVVYGMPMVAYNMGGVAEQLALNSIADAVMRRFT